MILRATPPVPHPHHAGIEAEGLGHHMRGGIIIHHGYIIGLGDLMRPDSCDRYIFTGISQLIGTLIKNNIRFLKQYLVINRAISTVILSGPLAAVIFANPAQLMNIIRPFRQAFRPFLRPCRRVAFRRARRAYLLSLSAFP